MRTYSRNKKISYNNPEDIVLVENDHPAIISPEQYQICIQKYHNREKNHYQRRTPLFGKLLYCSNHRKPLAWIKENDRLFNSLAKYQCNACSDDVWITDTEIGTFVFSYLHNLLNLYREWTPDIPETTLKKRLLRGTVFKGIKEIEKEEFQNFLLAIKQAHFPDTFDEKKLQALRFDIQLEERALEKLARLYNYKDSDLTESEYQREKKLIESRIRKIKEQIAELSSPEQSSIPIQIDFLSETYQFFLKHKLLTYKTIDFNKIFQDIPFYDLKHFLENIISRINVKNGAVSSITFISQENYVHHFVR